MPAHFGGFDCVGPETALYYRDAVPVTFVYTADEDQLVSYVPEGFELLRPEINVSYSQFERSTRWQEEDIILPRSVYQPDLTQTLSAGRSVYSGGLGE